MVREKGDGNIADAHNRAGEEDGVHRDEDLIRLCKQGESWAWEYLVTAHQDRILNLAYQFAGNREEARDLAQEIFVRLYLRLDRYEQGRSFRTWFNSLARNLCIDHYRQRRQERRVVPTPVDEFTKLASSAPAPDQRVERRERKELLMRAMDTLSEISREAIVLKDLQEMTLEEIAEMLRLPIGTVKSRIFRARIELGRAIQKLQQATATSGGGVGL
jgi:RNA polymerase sigma-70 factor (ECF subfamily)